MTKEPKSKCCNAAMKVVCGDDFGTPNDQVTYHYECTKCEEACDAQQLGEEVGGPAPKASNSSGKPDSSKEEAEKECECGHKTGRHFLGIHYCEEFGCHCENVTPWPKICEYGEHIGPIRKCKYDEVECDQGYHCEECGNHVPTPQPESEGVGKNEEDNMTIEEAKELIGNLPKTIENIFLEPAWNVWKTHFNNLLVAQDIISRKDQKQKDKEGLIQMAEAGEYEELRGCVESYFANKPI